MTTNEMVMYGVVREGMTSRRGIISVYGLQSMFYGDITNISS